MKNKESRRLVPVSTVALAAFAVLVVVEVLVIGGALEMKASTVARIAPWAYEPFLKLVGEHPESFRPIGTQREAVKKEGGGSAMDVVAGFNPAEIVATNAPSDTNASPAVPDAAIPDEAAVPDPKTLTREVVPVG